MKNLKTTSIIPFNTYNSEYFIVNGLYSLKQLKPIFIKFAKLDTSDLVRGATEESESIWANTNIKTIGRIRTKPQNLEHFTNFGKGFLGKGF